MCVGLRAGNGLAAPTGAGPYSTMRRSIAPSAAVGPRVKWVIFPFWNRAPACPRRRSPSGWPVNRTRHRIMIAGELPAGQVDLDLAGQPFDDESPRRVRFHRWRHGRERVLGGDLAVVGEERPHRIRVTPAPGCLEGQRGDEVSRGSRAVGDQPIEEGRRPGSSSRWRPAAATFSDRAFSMILTATGRYRLPTSSPSSRSWSIFSMKCNS